jgi:hypothetical protein
MGYIKGLCVFIDILGTKEKSYEDLLKINETFHRAFDEMEERTANLSRLISSFSDCAYMVYDTSSIIDSELYILSILNSISSMVRSFVFYGFIFRGGISFGEVYFDNKKNILFGPCVNKSYELETKGGMPRIIIEDKLARQLLDYLKNDKKDITDHFKYIILADKIDRRYYLNYLFQFIHTPSQFGVFLNEARKLSQQNIDKQLCKDNPNNDIIAKHQWNLNYYEMTNNILKDYKIK